MSDGTAKLQDPRVRLVREKYFSVRPKPLERWLWSKNIPASAERVFWLHWQEGQLSRDWCSEIPLRRVAHECGLDISTVTRAYQFLTRLGCIRRTDPGRDPANPFQQATAVTEVRIPAELLQVLHQYPNRRPPTEATQDPEAGRAEHTNECPATPPDVPKPTAPDANPAISHTPSPTSPLQGLNGRGRAKAIAEITANLSPADRDAYHRALRLHLPTVPYGPDSQIAPAIRGLLQNTLDAAHETRASATTPPRTPAAPCQTPKAPPRKLSLFHIARLRRDIQSATSSSAAPELLRQVVWSIEAGALRRFAPLHALNIALKKVREGSWTRPHRMPPNWACASSTRETCSAA